MGDIVTLAEVKDQLNIPQENTNEDTEIGRYITAVSEGIVFNCGAVTPTQYTERAAAGPVLVLRHRPVLSVVSVVPVLPGLLPVDVTTLDVDGSAGIVGLLGYCGYTWAFPRPVVVTYTAGLLAAPQSLKTAAAMIVQHLHKTQRRAGPGAGQGGDDVSQMPGFAFAVPNRAKELMQPFLRTPGMA